MLPVLGLISPEMVWRVVDFPAPLEPIRVTISPVPHFHVQVLHGVDGPIIDIQIFNGEHQDTSSPR